MPQVVIENTSTIKSERKVTITSTIGEMNHSPSDSDHINIKVINQSGSVQLIFDSPLKTIVETGDHNSRINLLGSNAEIILNDNGDKITISKISGKIIAKIREFEINDQGVDHSIQKHSASDHINIQFDKTARSQTSPIVVLVQAKWNLFTEWLRKYRNLITPKADLHHGASNIYLDRFNF
ncbi:MAG: hypothetical protein HON98_06590 [Chloroflexi bacterium]|nr:hypothetical protein [Chloroflexota bacterium]MBT3669433.1 hypothetical protein [Chloroflexota bacterium]MBT4004205.1 hypothetical protein [Chloroflexota bacterium]MBT4304548.1 hypothetical protein [Chloroflexota bacterium]MBT4534111.1 hypothetical protein [Chloroflexota bacterium]